MTEQEFERGLKNIFGDKSKSIMKEYKSTPLAKQYQKELEKLFNKIINQKKGNNNWTEYDVIEFLKKQD